MKDLIRSLGSNKTDNSIKAISKACSVIHQISDNYSEMLNIKDHCSSHTHRSKQEDIAIAIGKLTEIKACLVQNGRSLSGFKRFSVTPFSFSKQRFLQHVKDTVLRLRRNLPNIDDDEI